ncbi:hypothetical protein L9F63_013410, partial [Diploptera punctata]
PPSWSLVKYKIQKERDGERESSYLGLKIQIRSIDFVNGRLKIRCSASIHDIYYQSTEKSIEEERPRGLLSSNPSSGIQLIQPPSVLITDLPPPGHRFEQDVHRDGGTSETSGVVMIASSSLWLLVFLLFTVR